MLGDGAGGKCSRMLLEKTLVAKYQEALLLFCGVLKYQVNKDVLVSITPEKRFSSDILFGYSQECLIYSPFKTSFNVLPLEIQ